MAKKAIAAADVMDMNTVLSEMLKTALIHEGPAGESVKLTRPYDPGCYRLNCVPPKIHKLKP